MVGEMGNNLDQEDRDEDVTRCLLVSIVIDEAVAPNRRRSGTALFLEVDCYFPGTLFSASSALCHDCPRDVGRLRTLLVRIPGIFMLRTIPRWKNH
jgi:hypothetical protein